MGGLLPGPTSVPPIPRQGGIGDEAPTFVVVGVVKLCGRRVRGRDRVSRSNATENTNSLTHFSVVTQQFFPFFPFNSFVNVLTDGVPVCVIQRGSPSLKFNVFCVDENPVCPPHQRSKLTHLLLP